GTAEAAVLPNDVDVAVGAVHGDVGNNVTLAHAGAGGVVGIRHADRSQAVNKNGGGPGTGNTLLSRANDNDIVGVGGVIGPRAHIDRRAIGQEDDLIGDGLSGGRIKDEDGSRPGLACVRRLGKERRSTASGAEPIPNGVNIIGVVRVGGDRFLVVRE